MTNLIWNGDTTTCGTFRVRRLTNLAEPTDQNVWALLRWTGSGWTRIGRVATEEIARAEAQRIARAK